LEWKKERRDTIEFGMKILKATRSAYERQVLESVNIQKDRRHNIMNNKSEWNRCALPRLTAKLGEVDLEKWREGDKEEMMREANAVSVMRVARMSR
jgi:hypothetical protein